MKIKKLFKPKKNKKKANTVSQKIRPGLFHRQWYLSKNPDVARSGLDPEEHYRNFGDAEGRWPNPYFDPNYYRSIAPGARKSGGLALAHFAEKGWQRGRNPSRKFSLKLYLEQYPDVAEAGTDPLSYHFERGQFEGKLAFNIVLEREGSAALIADMQRIHNSGLFDAGWYRKYYSDLWHADFDPLHHFVKHGWKEKRSPNVFFDTAWYVHKYGGDLGEDLGEINPLIYYIEKGFSLGHNPSPQFICETYFRKNPDLDPEKTEPLAHFLRHGMANGLKQPYPAEGKEKRLRRDAKLPVSDDLRGILHFKRAALNPDSESFDPDCMNIHWVIPDFAAGGGGHMTIFRMVHFLELAGHKQTIWINNPTLHKTPADAYRTIENHFQHFTGDVRFIDEDFANASGDAIIATDCWTVYPVLGNGNFHRRFYFVQDHEPSFHPMGANYLIADQTYHEDLDCICASPWLADLMSQKYGRWARHFWLAADRRIYFPAEQKPKNEKPRIAVYARHFTARRAVELAMLALEDLADRGVEFVVDFFGAPLSLTDAPFEFIDHGVASQEDLAQMFRKADIGVVFSATNYSLVPQEMMACGLPIVELDGESTRAIFPPETVTLAGPHPAGIADALQDLIGDPTRQATQAQAALEWVSGFSWSASADLVEAALRDRMSEFARPEPKPKPKPDDKPKASIVIPTLNAGPVFEGVLDAVLAQRAPWPFEILVVDSGSTDETLDIVAKHPSVRLHQIDKKDFNHGATRNLGAELTSGDFIAFLTHDAKPYNDRWLYNMVTAIERHPNAAGAFGRHLAWPDASPFTKRDLNAHFETFSHMPLAVDKGTKKKRWKEKDPEWMQKLHFYSDNNSCMRREVFEKLPYRTVAFGEDQLWAWDIINEGYQKVYAPQAVVFHSHDYDEAETFERSKTESAFFKHFFGYELMKDKKTLEDTLDVLNLSDTDWGEAHFVPQAEIDERKRLNKARLEGYLAGCQADTSEMF